MNSRSSKRLRILINVVIWVVASLLAVAFLSSIILAIVAAFAQRGHGQHWATLTGPIGDTFGGILGPMLNAAVLATTVWVAVYWQPKQDRKRREEADKRRDQEERLDRASDIVGWVAETEDHSYYGVVVRNDADSLVRMVDIKVRANDAPHLALRPDREESLPRGTWFIPFATNAGVLKSEWMLPVPVREAHGMRVEMNKLVADASVNEVVELYLRPHVRETQNGRDQPFFSLDLFRYQLHGQVWVRTMDGRPQRTGIGSVEESEYAGYARTMRTSAQTSVGWRRVTPTVDQLVNHTLDLLRTDNVAAADRSPADLRKGIDVNQSILPGVTRISRPQGGRLVLELDEPIDTRIELWGKFEQYPEVSFASVRPHHHVVFEGAKQSSGQIRRAAVVADGLGKNAGDLLQNAGDWLSSEQAKAQWLIALRAMVEKAAEATVEPSSVPSEGNTVP
jgi:uncharacterized membrane protein